MLTSLPLPPTESYWKLVFLDLFPTPGVDEEREELAVVPPDP